jgi:hypothetical protein
MCPARDTPRLRLMLKLHSILQVDLAVASVLTYMILHTTLLANHRQRR